ncbi:MULTISPECIES: hypothetical protein [Bacteroidaceae]|uniref:hypothetical protein n=1 Tax=Bacteroidaceae TaxID=815 RepID=UPI001F33D1B4|nr:MULTISPECIES: hypothetical protein [Bacteroidaceae]MCE8841115.1 hypothetical protein [Bacteroides thetaiotaomicron]MCE8861310.1 hypothetical protein [Phocaeicola vulgatus]
MRKEVIELSKLGQMPNESINDTEMIINTIRSYDVLLSRIKAPITYEEGLVLISLFPESSFYDLQWDLLKLVELLIKSTTPEEYLSLVDKCPSKEWKELLKQRFYNWLHQNSK